MSRHILENTNQLAATVSTEEEADIYFWNGPINEHGLGSLVKKLGSKNKNAILILVTYGGSANSAYRVARLFQNFYDAGHFTVVAPSYCKSAGTLIVLGANRLVMSEFGELGPLDVQLYKRDEIGERRSGLLLKSALINLRESSENLFSHLMLTIKGKSGGLVRFKLASDLAAHMTVGLLAPVYTQMTPDNLGEDYQDLKVAYEYGTRLAKVGGLISDEAIHNLVHGYPSHDFVIDKREASDLFVSVDEPSEAMLELILSLGEIGAQPNDRHVTVERLSDKEVHEDEENDDTGIHSISGPNCGDEGKPENSDG